MLFTSLFQLCQSFGYPDKPTQAGWDIERIASAWDELMMRLGYDQYYAQGGNWGAIVTAAIGFPMQPLHLKESIEKALGPQELTRPRYP